MPVRAVHLQEEVRDVDHSTKRLPATNLMSMMLRAIAKVFLVMTMMLLAKTMVLVDNIDGGGVGDGLGVVGHHATGEDPVHGLRVQLRVEHRPLT